LKVGTPLDKFLFMKSAIVAFLLLFSVSAFAEEVLIIGDSLTCGSFGRQLLKNLTDRGDSVTLFCTVSSAPIHWLEGRNPAGFVCKTMSSRKPTLENCGTAGVTPKVDDILAGNNSTTVIVALGTNTLYAGRTDATYRRVAQTVASAQRRCLWVGPPRLNESESKGYPKGRVAELDTKLTTFYPSLVQVTNTFCKVIDSRPATAPGTPGIHTTDGIHRTSAAGIFWANQLKPQF
jgi:hypothetical protein